MAHAAYLDVNADVDQDVESNRENSPGQVDHVDDPHAIVIFERFKHTTYTSKKLFLLSECSSIDEYIPKMPNIADGMQIHIKILL